MALDKYKEKRKFSKTPEPTGGKSQSDKLVFVVQKHEASHLHYDFRLEMRGILKSWAVPKGPSMNPEDHRLAQEVEDHPFDYKDFEGIIPKGQYGGGTVIIWDQGTYEPAEKIKGKKEQEHLLISHYYKNNLRIVLKGKKLKGEFLLVRNKERGENSWLLSKVNDKYANKKDIRDEDKSVVSGLTIEEMGDNADASVWQSNRAETKAKTNRKKTSNRSSETDASSDFPQRIAPMLATLTREVKDDPDLLYEVKWDGYRIISYVNDGKVKLASRSNLDYTKKYPLVVKALEDLGHDVILDGEMVVFNEEGTPDFDAVQAYNGHTTPIYYCVFDLLWMDGHDLMRLPLLQRKALLQALLKDNQILRFSESHENGTELFQEMSDKGWEGIIAKRKDSIYVPGQRGENWLKIPTRIQQEFVIGAWAESAKGRLFKSLLFGAYNSKAELEWIGRSGGGYKEKDMPEIMTMLKAIEIEKSPFVNPILDTKGATIHYVKPELVANFAFATWTKSGRIRKPATFIGFRNDKDPKSVVREVPKEESMPDEPSPMGEIEDVQNIASGNGYLNEDSNWKELDKIEIVEQHDLPVEGFTITVNNLDKVLWKDEGIRKTDLLSYYASIAPYILPHLKNRPLSLYLKHVAPTAPGLYIKDMEGRQPDYAEIFSTERKHKKKGKRSTIDYLVCNNTATLLYIINLGAIDINPWSSTISNPDFPDYVTIDLDPSDGDFSKAIDTALVTKEFLDENKITAFVKTSGKTGLHILIPCSGFNFAEARKIGSEICDAVQRRIPELTTRQRSVGKRGNLLYVDDSQNDFADTIASVYSVRPYHIPTVSTPLKWKEVNRKLDPADFTLNTISKRIQKKGDLFSRLLDDKVKASNNNKLRTLLSGSGNNGG